MKLPRFAVLLSQPKDNNNNNKIQNESKTARLGFFEVHLQHYFMLKKLCNPGWAGPGWAGHNFF